VLSSENIGNLENLLRSRHVLISVSRLKALDSRSCPGLVQLLIIKKSWYRPFVNFSRGLVLGLVAKCWSCPSLAWAPIHKNIRIPLPIPSHYAIFGKTKGRFSKVILQFQNFVYEF
jgi:hypothetical protein